ncbi:MAG: DNA polymerase IV, partial [Chloroflexi bacterium]|nr:DNA polymerase IV [Chloroflexota bacterium]
IQIYSETSRQVMELLDGFSGRIEQVSVDEAFLDLSDVADDGETLARRIQACIRDRLDLPCSIGVATNKLVAKIATDVGKKAAPDHTRPPYAITVVPAGEEAAFLAPLPADMLWGVGPKTASRLASLGMHTIGDIAAWPERELHARFGEAGLEIARHARGQDARPVATGRDVKSISQEVTFARDLRDDRDLDRTLRDLSADVGRRLRRADLAGNTVKIKIRWPDFTTLSRQSRLLQATDQDDEIFETAVQLLRKVRPAGKAVRLVGVGVSGLAAPTRQLSLWDDGSEKSRRLLTVLDELRQKYGEQAIQRGGMDDTRRAEHGWLHHRRSEEEA